MYNFVYLYLIICKLKSESVYLIIWQVWRSPIYLPCRHVGTPPPVTRWYYQVKLVRTQIYLPLTCNQVVLPGHSNYVGHQSTCLACRHVGTPPFVTDQLWLLFLPALPPCKIHMMYIKTCLYTPYLIGMC